MYAVAYARYNASCITFQLFLFRFYRYLFGRNRETRLSNVSERGNRESIGKAGRFPRELSILNIKKLPRIGSKHIFPTLVQSRIHLRSSIDDNFGDKSADIPPRIVQDLLTTVMTALFFIEKSRKISLEISASYCTRTTTLDPHSNHAHDPKNFFLFHKFSKEAFCRCGFERIR